MKLKTLFSIIFFITVFALLTFNNQTVFALPQYCNYDQFTQKCCGGGTIDCTDVDPVNPSNNSSVRVPV